MLTINDWTVLSHALFLDQWERLIETVEALKTKKLED
jgi:toxin YhaV